MMLSLKSLLHCLSTPYGSATNSVEFHQILCQYLENVEMECGKPGLMKIRENSSNSTISEPSSEIGGKASCFLLSSRLDFIAFLNFSSASTAFKYL
jgi:hypothetical protein